MQGDASSPPSAHDGKPKRRVRVLVFRDSGTTDWRKQSHQVSGGVEFRARKTRNMPGC